MTMLGNALNARQLIKLDPKEWSDFHDIRNEAQAWRFWQAVANERGLDPHSLYSSDGTVQKVSGLPLGHGKHWCWPVPLKCKYDPRAVRTEDRQHPARGE